MSAPTPLQFYVEVPLYEPIRFDSDDAASIILWSEGPLDIHCPWCGQHSIFKRHVAGTYGAKDWLQMIRTMATFQCSRSYDHKLLFWLEVDGAARTMQKIGQSPSLATLCSYDLKKYGSVLEKGMFRELTKAVGLAAHGIGIGSFVYLRRIFEFLVEEAHVRASSQADWDDSKYLTARMADKINMLANYLPQFLVEHRVIYGILSKGIHELSEGECLAAFPAVKMGIEIILDQKIRADEEKRKIDEAKKAIQLASSSLKSA